MVSCLRSHSNVTAQFHHTARIINNNPNEIRHKFGVLFEQPVQLLLRVLVMSSLDYFNALSAELQTCAIKCLQMIQNDWYGW